MPYPEEQHHSFKDKFKKRFKILLVLLTLVISGALFFSAYTGSPNFITAAVVSGAHGGAKVGPFIVSGTVAIPKLAVDAKDTNLDLKLKEGGTLVLGDISINAPASAHLILSGFVGKLALVEGGVLGLDGSVNTVMLNDASLARNNKAVKINAQNLGLDQLTVSAITIKSLKFASSGNVEVKDRGTFVVAGEGIEITPFMGTISIVAGQLKFEGESKYFALDKTPRVVVGQ